MKIDIYQVDAFSEKLFGGNPAAVCPLPFWIEEALMQKIAMENNLAETAFIVKKGEVFEIRWFTPTVEVDLCGHATLATAHILIQELENNAKVLNFSSKSGPLKVIKKDNFYLLDFPTDTVIQVENINIRGLIEKGLGCMIDNIFRGKDDFLVALGSEEQVRRLSPDFKTLKELPARGIIVTAPGENVDFVSRCFYPPSGIDEDPTTGSAHCALSYFWNVRLRKNHMTARQLSSRIGNLQVIYKGSRTLLKGSAITYLQGTIQI